MLLSLAAAALIWRLAVYEPAFQPPEMELTAQYGVPSPPETLRYGAVSVDNGFSFSIAGTMYQQQDASLLVYFTNPTGSGCNMQCVVSDENGNTLYRSGAVPPGCYVEKLAPVAEMKNEAMPIEICVYAFEPGTWYSMGTIELANTLYPW